MTLGIFPEFSWEKKRKKKTSFPIWNFTGPTILHREFPITSGMVSVQKNPWVIVKLIGFFVSFRGFFVKILAAKHFEPPKIVGSLLMFLQP